MEYNDYNDYELISYIFEGNEDANNIIIEKYQPLINGIVSKMIKYCHNSGMDYSDLKQEGMIGLTDALNTFSEQKNTTFYTYAKTCIERRIISTVISSNRLKHRILNDSLSYDQEETFLDNVLKDNSSNPEQIVISQDEKNHILALSKKKLTKLETQVFELMISGLNYKEIADILDKDTKSIDNTIQRIRGKVKDVIKEIK